MSEATPEAPAQEQPAGESQPPATTPTVEELQTRLEEVTKEARKWETRSKENHQARAELEKQRQASMTEAEKAVAEAEQRGRTTAVAEYGKRLATAEIRTAAADAGADLAGVFDYLDLSRFVGEDGEPDTKAIGAFVGGLPKRDTTPPPLDLGARQTPSGAPGMSQLIRKAAGRA